MTTFFYKRIKDGIRKQKKNAVILILGQVGSGKSYTGLRIGEDLDKTFSAERVCYSVKDYLKLLDVGDSKGKIKRGHVVVLDEIAGSEQGADSRAFMSKENQLMSYVMTIARAKGIITIIIAPFQHQIDRRVREIGVTCTLIAKKVYFKKQRCKCAFYWSVPNALLGKIYRPKARIMNNRMRTRVTTIHFSPPSPELIKDYEKKKAVFIKGNIHEWHQKLDAKSVKELEDTRTPMEKMKEVMVEVKKKAKEYVNTRGLFSPDAIKVETGLSQAQARTVALRLNKELAVR